MVGVMALLIVAATMTRALAPVAAATSPANLSSLPYAIEEWKGAEGPSIDGETLRILGEGAERAQHIARRTLAKARQRMGLVPRP